MAHQRRLDLARLDAEAAQLHLRIGPPEELQHPVRAPAREVAGAVHAAPRRPERIGHEPLRRQPGPPEITARQPRARDVELARNPRRHRLQAPVQHVNPRVPDRSPDRRTSRAGQRLAHGGADRRLGRAVGVDHPPARRPARHHVRGTGLAGDDQGLQRQVLRQIGEQHRWQCRMRDFVRADELGQRIAAALVRSGQYECCTAQQR